MAYKSVVVRGTWYWEGGGWCTLVYWAITVFLCTRPDFAMLLWIEGSAAVSFLRFLPKRWERFFDNDRRRVKLVFLLRPLFLQGIMR